MIYFGPYCGLLYSANNFLKSLSSISVEHSFIISYNSVSYQFKHKLAIFIGEKFVPGSDQSHFCKPTSVVVSKSGNVYIADG